MSRLLAFGDIHGCYRTLQNLLGKVNLRDDDELVFLGDYIDRGASSYEVIELLIELNKKYKCTFLKGNHEDMWIDYLQGEMRLSGYQLYFQNGGRSTLESYCQNLVDEDGNQRRAGDGLSWDELPESHREFYDNLKVMHEDGEFVFVHAGIMPNLPLEDQEEQIMMWIRNEFVRFKGTVLFNRVVVHGHTPMDRYELLKYNDKHDDRLNLDSGCVFGYHLTCMDVRTGFRHQQKCIDARTS